MKVGLKRMMAGLKRVMEVDNGAIGPVSAAPGRAERPA